ncbi:hypothetical protein ACX0G9_14015 [Flavitalea flava]
MAGTNNNKSTSNNSPKKGRGFRSPYVLAVIGGLIAAVALWQFFKYRIAEKGIHKGISEKSYGLYTIHYDDLVIDEVAGQLHVKHIEISPDTTVFNRMVKEGNAPPVIIRLNIPALDIAGIKTPKALLNKEIEGGKVELFNPALEVILTGIAKDSTLFNPGKDLYKTLLGKLLKIKLDSISVHNAKVVVRNKLSETGADKNAEDFLFKGENVSCLLTDLLIDSTTDKDNSRILFSKELGMTCDEFVLPSKNKKYRLMVEKLRFVSRDNSFYIGQLRLIPQLPEEEFARSFPKQKDRYDFTLEGIALHEIDRGSLWHKKLEAESLLIQKSSFKIYRDLSYPRDTISKVGKFPQQQLMHLPVPFLIKTVKIENSFIEYKEKNGKSDSAGKMQLFNAHATITNVTNEKEAIARNNKCILFFNASFLNQAPVKAKLTMILKDPRGNFFIEGNIGTIKAPNLNPLTQPMGLARMETGTIRNIAFNFEGTDSSSSGKLTMLYDDLKISLLKKDKEENKYDKKGLASLAANILIKNDNPGKNGKVRIAEVHYNRALNKSFFNMIWKSILTGVKESVGIK